jgi:hypothetical protein
MKRKRPAYRFIAALFAILTSAGCGEEQMQQEIDTTTPVVESYLEEGATALSVKLYTMEVYLGEEYILSRPVTGLNLSVNGMALTETAAGTYSLSLDGDTIREGQAYQLQFAYLDREISASTVVPPALRNLHIEPSAIERPASYGFWSTEQDSLQITLTWDNPDNGYYQIYIDASATTSTFPGNDFRRRMMQPVQADTYTFSSRDFMTTGNYYIYVYRVNREYVELYERVSSSDLANPVSFIDNALGIFTAVSVARVMFTVVEAE